MLGGAPGTRETDLLEPHNTVQTVDAVVLSGGSAFGLDAASGVQAALARDGTRLSPSATVRMPIVPAAILFDLINGGDKDWGRYPPYRELGYQAVQAAALDFATGTAGAGTGALTATFKGGLGTASSVLDNGITVGALVAVNALGSATIGDTRHFWAAPFEEGRRIRRPRHAASVSGRMPAISESSSATGRAETQNTTIAIIATDAVLTKAEAKTAGDRSP